MFPSLPEVRRSLMWCLQFPDKSMSEHGKALPAVASGSSFPSPQVTEPQCHPGHHVPSSTTSPLCALA